MTRPQLRILFIVGTLFLAVGAVYLTAGKGASGPREQGQPTMTCDMGISAARQSRQTTGDGSAQSEAPSLNRAAPSGPVSEGMLWIPGGEFWMGTDEFPDARPLHRVYVDGFWMDKTEVTTAQFQEFVNATGYVTIAERAPRAEDFPGAPPENLVAGSVVFSPPGHPVKLHDHFQWWSYIKGANWRHPEGPNSDIAKRGNYPVVHIAYDDALAYAKWAGKRLPTEAEFEFAQRGGLDRKTYAWGDDFRPAATIMANTFQGHFPDHNTVEDGYATAAPVGSFPPNGYGLYDMTGNVWEWTSDWYRHDYYRTLAAQGSIIRNPQGPPDSVDPSEPGVKKKVHKGGSFLCTDQYCARYIAGGRGKGEPDTGTNHVGFRLVKSEQRDPPVQP